MQFFSEDYLMHYGIKGMKWKKKKRPEVGEPEGYLAKAYEDVYGYTLTGVSGDALKTDKSKAGEFERSKIRERWTQERRLDEGIKHNPKFRQMDNRVRMIADSNRRQDQKAAREYGYKKNQKRIAKQQRKAKVKNALKKVKNKVFTDTSGMKKVGSHTYVKFDEPVITSTSGSRNKKRR